MYFGIHLYWLSSNSSQINIIPMNMQTAKSIEKVGEREKDFGRGHDMRRGPRRYEFPPLSPEETLEERVANLRLNLEHDLVGLRAHGVSKENLRRIRPELEAAYATEIIEDIRRFDVGRDEWPLDRTGILDAREAAEAKRLLEAFRKKNFEIGAIDKVELERD